MSKLGSARNMKNHGSRTCDVPNLMVQQRSAALSTSGCGGEAKNFSKKGGDPPELGHFA